MPRLKITVSDNQLRAIDKARGTAGLSEFIRQVLEKYIVDFDANEVQHGGNRHTGDCTGMAATRPTPIMSIR